jgi:hypothetical protein
VLQTTVGLLLCSETARQVWGCCCAADYCGAAAVLRDGPAGVRLPR